MLKKILGEAPFYAEMKETIVLSPVKEKMAEIVFINNSEYDLPLYCTFNIASFVNTDKRAFDVTVPAQGCTKATVNFSINSNERLFGGKKICELEIIDGIFDTKVLYEFEVLCEMCYKCCNSNEEAFVPSEEMLFSKNGVLFGNKGEIILLEIPCLEERKAVLNIVSGKIKDRKDGEIVFLGKGLNRVFFEMTEDGSFEFLDAVSEEKVFFETVSVKYFI